MRAGPRLTLERACVYAGTYGQHESFDTTLVVRNEGDAELTLGDVTTNCICITVKARSDRIKPGATTELRVRAETADFLGRMRREIRIASNDPSAPVTRAVLEFDVVRAIALDSPRLHLGVVRPGERITRDLAVRLRGVERVRWLYAVARDPALQVRLPSGYSTTEQPGRVQVVVRIPERVGPFHTSATIHTDHPDPPKLTVSITAYVSRDVTVSAPLIDMARFARSGDVAATLDVRCAEGTRIQTVSLTTDGLRVTRETTGPNTTLRIRPTRRLDLGTFATVLRIETAGREEQTIQIPITGTVVD